ncbi:MAG: response regulator transcription factor [Candidatus Eisenbacteria bacterium]
MLSRIQDKQQGARADQSEDQLRDLRDSFHDLLQCLGATCRELRQARSLLAADPPSSGSAHRAVQQALAENDRAYSIMVKLRWSLLRKTDPEEQPRLEERRMDDSQPIVFVVDDSASVRRALSRLLSSVGLRVEVFSSAHQFLEHVLPDVPSCVVLDVRMPRMSGLDLQKEMARRGLEVPIVFITGHGDIRMAVKAMKSGAVDFLPKPFNDQDLIDSINRALDRNRSQRVEEAEIADVQARADRLTPRERQVMELVITGMLNKQVAFELGTSEKTIKVHRARVMEKMEVESLAELVRLVARIGIEGPPDSSASTD